jgi:hypothetical protein
VYQPAITVGPVTIELGTIASTTAVYQPFLGVGTAQGISLNTIASTTTIYQVAILAIAAGRIYRVPAENRIFTVESESRIFVVMED